MAVLVDTSVWSLLLLRRRQSIRRHEKVRILQELMESNETIFVTGIIVQEILQGVRSEQYVRQLAEYFRSINQVPTTIPVHVEAAKLYRRCRQNGVWATTIDCLIASAAVSENLALLTADKDFERLRAFCGLRLL